MFEGIKRLREEARQLEAALEEHEEWSDERIEKQLDRIEAIYKRINMYLNAYVNSQ